MIILKSNLVRFPLLLGNQISSSCARYYDIDSWTRQSGIAVVGNASYRKHGAYSREARKKIWVVFWKFAICYVFFTERATTCIASWPWIFRKTFSEWSHAHCSSTPPRCVRRVKLRWHLRTDETFLAMKPRTSIFICGKSTRNRIRFAIIQLSCSIWYGSPLFTVTCSSPITSHCPRKCKVCEMRTELSNLFLKGC